MQIEVEKIKKESKEKMKEYEDKLQKKNKIINDLLTESENTKTELTNIQSKVNIRKAEENKLKTDLENKQAALISEQEESA